MPFAPRRLERRAQGQARAQQGPQGAEQEPNKEDSAQQQPLSRSERVFSALLRRVFDLEPEVLDAFFGRAGSGGAASAALSAATPAIAAPPTSTPALAHRAPHAHHHQRGQSAVVSPQDLMLRSASDGKVKRSSWDGKGML